MYYVTYFSERVWGEDWYAVIVVIVLWYHRLMDIGTLLYHDIYIREWMDDIKSKYHHKFDKKSFEWELKRPIKEYEYQQIIYNIIPISYNLLLFILLIMYLYNTINLT